MIANDDESDLALSGQQKIDWARRSMPVLASIETRLIASGVLKGKRIGVSFALEPKAVNLVLALRNAGADVTVWSPAASVQNDVVHALQAEGIKVFADAQATAGEDLASARALLATGPEILVDDGARLISLAQREFPEVIKHMMGAVEQTASGVQSLHLMAVADELHMPVINVSDSRLNDLFANMYGSGQSCVMALLDVTNLQVAGRNVLVVGYGSVGKGVASHAAALGARVTVAESDPVKCLQALHDGHHVKSIMDAAPSTEVVFACTGHEGVITPDHLMAMADYVVLCTAGSCDSELPINYLNKLNNPKDIRAQVVEYTLPNGKHVLLVAGGQRINHIAGEGNPVEIMDLSLSVQFCAIEDLAVNGQQLAVGIHPISVDIENAIATERLAVVGASVEPATPKLADAMTRSRGLSSAQT